MLLTLGCGLSPRQNSGTIFQPVITTLSDFPFIFAAFTPDNVNNSSITVNQDFTAPNIETTTNEIDVGLFDERSFRTDGRLGRSGVKITDWSGEFPTSFTNGVVTMWLSFPPESLLPLREDTNTRMVSGTYYMTKSQEAVFMAGSTRQSKMPLIAWA